MPPFTTLNGQTGYFDNNGQFIPATQEEYNQQFGMLQQFGGNPFLNAAQQSPLNNQRTNFVQQGTIETPKTAPQTNEQKVMQAQGDETPMLGNMPYVKMGNEYGVQKGKSFYPYNAMTASGHPLNTTTNTVFNAYDLMASRKNKVVNPLEAEIRLAESNQAQNLFNALQNPYMPTQTTVEAPIAAAPEIIPTPTAEQTGGSNWFSNMFNKPSVEGVPNAQEAMSNTTEGTGDVLGDWGKLGFNGKEFFSSEKGQDISALTGAGVGLASSLIKAGAQDKYDPRVGMSKPNLAGNLFGDATFTQVGLNPALMAATGGISALVGGGVDLIKNAVKYAKQKDRYENKKLGVDTMQSIEDARENMKPDYTGYARYGTQVKNPYLPQARSGIYIKPENRGKFTKWAKSHDMGVQEAANTVMANKEEYSPSVVKMANFAKNAKKWGRFGMETDPEKKNDVYEAVENNISLESAGKSAPEPDDLEYNKIKAWSTMDDIYSSKGYQKKLANEIKQSNKMSSQEQVVYENPFAPNLQQTRHEVYNKDINKNYEGRSLLQRRKEALDPEMVSYMDKNDNLYDTTRGYYMPTLNTVKGEKYGVIGEKTRKQQNPYIKIKPGINNKYYTLIEEYEHASHYPALGRTYTTTAARPSGQNITPYAQKVIKENTGLKYEDSSYLTELTEVLAKKRATEAYLIENNLLKPGEKVNKSHYDFLEKNYTKLPNNVNSMFDITDENIDLVNPKTNKKEHKKRRQTQYKRFNNIMNKIAMQQNPYIDEPIS